MPNESPIENTNFELPRSSADVDSTQRTEPNRGATQVAHQPDSTQGALLTPSPVDGTMIQGANNPSQGAISLPSVQVPELPPDYEVIQEIARGGMGVVYKARQKRLNRVVALKMILPQMLYDQSMIDRFYQEARAAAGLDHPNVVPIYEVGEYRGQHYFSMAFIEGESLRHRIKRKPPSVREAVKFLIGISDGVGYAHKLGIIHRDLKPDNVLIDHHGNPRVTDFGLAKQVEANAGLTATGQVMGTPAFMSPEQALGGKRIIGPQTDVYALGAILYNMLTGETPFDGDSVTEVLCKVISDKPPSLQAKAPEVPGSLNDIYVKAMAKDPTQRYADATELRDALKAWEESADAAPTRLSTRQAPTATDGEPLFQNTLIPASPGDSAPTPESAGNPRRGGTPGWLIPVMGVLVCLIGAGIFALTRGGSGGKEVAVAPSPGSVSDEGKGKAKPEVNPKDKPDLKASAPGTTPAVTQQVPLLKPERQDFKVKVEFLNGKPGDDGVWVLKADESISCRITCDRDAYVGVWSVNADNTQMQLYPNDESNELFKANKPGMVPGGGLEIGGEISKGIDQLLVIASNKPFDREKAGVSGPFTVFAPEDRPKFEKVTRGLILRPKQDAVSQEIIPFRVVK